MLFQVINCEWMCVYIYIYEMLEKNPSIVCTKKKYLKQIFFSKKINFLLSKF